MVSRHKIVVENSEEVVAVHREADSGNWIFLCHGFAGNKDRKNIGRAEKLNEKGFNTVCFDFRGNGESDGEFIEQNLSSRISDLKAVIDHFEPENYVLFGTSFGGKVVLHTSEDLSPEAVFTKAPVTYNSIMDKFRSVVEEKGVFEYVEGKPIDERFIEDLDSYSFGTVVENLEAPTIIFHGSADTTVHPENSFKAGQELDTDVSIHKLKGEKHSFSDEAEKKMLEIISDQI